MDLSIVAAVGSLFVSERVLKPKATVLAILGIVLAYDLTTKTQDVSSLRVYRGPSLVALTLMMFAYSLRTWRRNGVACDELIFLPGTQHGHQIGIEGPLIGVNESADESLATNNINNNIYASISTTDSLAQTITASTSSSSSSSIPASSQSQTTSLLVDMEESTGSAGGDSLTSSHSCSEGPSLEMVSLRSNQKKKVESTPIVAVEDVNTADDCNLTPKQGNCSDKDDTKSLLETKNAPLHTNSSSAEIDENDNDPNGTHTHHVVESSVEGGTATDYPETGSTSSPNTTNSTNRGIRARIRARVRTRLQHCLERYPRVAQLWVLFFNRSNDQANYTYAPSAPAVFGAALDLSVPVLFNFHIFILTFNHIQRPDYTGSDFYAKTLPLAFLAVLYARVVIPPGRRLRFWGTMKFTFAAPFYKVGVRDEFIGDCLTSWVRIGQDLVFATIYFFIVLWGLLSRRYGLLESGEIMAESWFVHNVVLPLVAILPLWLKYMQTLRQAYDANRRWPYLGNAFKYLSAALVIIYGTTHPDQRKSPVWISSFVFAMFYQIVWDVVMDWQMFEILPEISVVMSNTSASTESMSTTSSLRPGSRVLLSIRTHVFQPIQHGCQRLRAQISGLRNIQLRERRLYKTQFFYWKILAYNLLTRFTWMCCFLPAYHVSRSHRIETVVLTSTSDVQSYWGVLLPAAELFRRTLWGFLYLENKTIKMMDADSKYQRVGTGSGDCPYDDNDDTTINSKVNKTRIDLMPTWLGNQQEVAHNAATTRAKRRQKVFRYVFLFELGVWAAGAVILGCLVAL